MAWPFVESKMKDAPRGQGNLGVSSGGKPEKKSLPMKEPVGPIRSGKATNHGNCGTQRKG